MKSPSLFLKALVLTGFVSSIAGLVAYRTGYLDGLLYGAAYTSGPLSMDGSQPFSVDTPPPGGGTLMPSSKLMIVDDGRRKPASDTPRKDSTVKVTHFYMDETMSSSKSFIAIDFDLLRQQDSLKKDSANRALRMQPQIINVDSFYLINPIYGSKSGRIIEPQKQSKPAK